MKNSITIITGITILSIAQIFGLNHSAYGANLNYHSIQQSSAEAIEDINVISNSNEVKSISKSVTLKITGMTCAGCASHVSNTIDKIDGVLEQEVKYPGNIAVIKFDPDKTNAKDIIAAITKTGYKAEVSNADQTKK